MARPRKVSTEIMSDEVVEVKEDYRDVHNRIENEMIEQEVEMAKATPVEDVVPEITVQVVKPKVQEVKEQMPTAICDIEALSESDKEILVEKRIKAIIEQTQIPFIPAIIRYKEPETTAVPPMYAIADFDHRFVAEGWDFYRTNVRNPYVKDYLNLLVKIFNKPIKIIPRIVPFDWE